MFEHLQEFDKFCNLGKPRPSGIFQREIVLEERRIAVEKTEDESFQLFL